MFCGRIKTSTMKMSHEFSIRFLYCSNSLDINSPKFFQSEKEIFRFTFSLALYLCTEAMIPYRCVCVYTDGSISKASLQCISEESLHRFFRLANEWYVLLAKQWPFPLDCPASWLAGWPIEISLGRRCKCIESS